MLKRLTLLMVSVMLVINLSGCFALVAGVAGGAGTAIWLSGKLTEDFPKTYEHTIEATKSAISSLNLSIIKEVHEDNVAQFRANYTDGREVWIDVHYVTENSTKVEVRVGAMGSDKQAASLILKKIEGFL